MKFWIFFLLGGFGLSVSSLQGQAPVHAVFDSIQVSYIRQFDFVERFDGEILLQFHYGRYTINNKADIELVKEVKVERVQLLYSWFPTGAAYQKQRQRRLNFQRVAYLQKQLPELFTDPTIKWELIAQTKCNSPNDARNLFHGFVIRYRVD